MASGLTIEGIEAAKRAFGSGVVDLSVSSSLNKATALGRTAVNKSMRDTWAIKSRDINKALNIRKATRDRHVSLLLGVGPRIPLFAFSGKQQQRGRKGNKKSVTSVKLLKSHGRTALKRGFVATMQSGHQGIYRRAGKKRLPIKELTGPAIPQMMDDPKHISRIIDVVNKRLPDLFETDLNFRINKALGR